MSAPLPGYLGTFHILDGDTIRQPVDRNELVRFNADEHRRIGRTTVDGVDVSTVFLCIEHVGGMWFETMLFGGEYDGECWRYKTRAEAQAGHDRIVLALAAGENMREVSS